MNDIRNTPSVSAHSLADAPWRTSTRSQTSNCVEVAPLRPPARRRSPCATARTEAARCCCSTAQDGSVSSPEPKKGQFDLN